MSEPGVDTCQGAEKSARKSTAPERRNTPSTKIDAKLIGGAAIFGLGWGMVGVCPGPVLTSMVAEGPSALGFIAAMAAGVIVYEAVQRRVRTEAWSIRAFRSSAG